MPRRSVIQDVLRYPLLLDAEFLGVILLLRMLTYDYFSFVKALRDQDPRPWVKPRAWPKIDFPIAMVVFRESEVGARREE